MSFLVCWKSYTVTFVCVCMTLLVNAMEVLSIFFFLERHCYILFNIQTGVLSLLGLISGTKDKQVRLQQ